MSDASMRAAEREANTVEERAALLLARWRAGEWVERQIEAPCDGCVEARGKHVYIDCPDLLSSSPCRHWPQSCPVRSLPCPACNGSGVRTIPGRELAAYAGDDRARYLLGWLDGFPGSPDLGKWVRGLGCYGREACVLAAAAAYAEAFGRQSSGFPHLERDGSDLGDELHRIVLATLDEASEPTVRKAIQDALVSWSLGGSDD